jgi:hypothetical protein
MLWDEPFFVVVWKILVWELDSLRTAVQRQKMA